MNTRNLKRLIALSAVLLGMSTPCMAINTAPLAAPTPRHAAKEQDKITAKFNGHSYDYEYNGKKCTSAKKLGKHLDKRKKYRLSFYNLMTHEMMLEQVEALEAAGITIDSVESRNNRNANTQVISVSKLRRTAK